MPDEPKSTGDQFTISGTVVGSAIGRGASVRAGNITVNQQTADQPAGEVAELKRVLATARDALERLPLSADKDEVVGDLGKLTGELEKPTAEPSRVARYLGRIRDVAPAVEQILTANERILTGKQMEALRDALCGAFDQNSFDQMLRLRLEKNRAHLVTAEGFRVVVFKVIDVAHREGWVPDLVRAASSYNPGNPVLQKFCTEHPHLVAHTDGT